MLSAKQTHHIAYTIICTSDKFFETGVLYCQQTAVLHVLASTNADLDPCHCGDDYTYAD